MKSKYVMLASAMILSMSSFAQKDQIKAAEKALKGGNAVEAINQLKQAESTIAAASDSEKAQYNFVKGNALLDMAGKKMEPAKNYPAAAMAYQEVIAIEKKSGKSKYTSDAQTSLAQTKAGMVAAAQLEIDKSSKAGNKAAADLLYKTYEIDKSNMDNLYFAGIYNMKGEAYDDALNNFNELKKANYTGEATNYYAKNVVSDKEEFYGSGLEAKKNRDKQVSIKLASTPRDEKEASKKADIARYVALIYLQQNKLNEAKTAIAEAKSLAADPNDNDLLIAESQIYFGLGDMDNYKKVTTQLVEKNPTDGTLFFNLGAATAKTDPKAAEVYYKKAIAINPNDYGSNINLALMTMEGESKLVDEMNKLGTSDKDNKRYELLKKQRVDMFRSAIPYLEKAYELKSEEDVANTLLNVYGALELTAKKSALKAKMGK